MKKEENTIIIFTMPSCPKCPEAKKTAEEVAKKLGINFRVVDIKEDPYEGLMYQVMETPSIAVNDETIFFAEVPDRKTLEKEVKRFIK